MIPALLQFAALAAVIVVAGSRLSYFADVIAEKSGLGRTWIGLILIASVTSVPELTTGITSVAVVRVPDIAVGDVLGSCMFNLLIIAFMDFFGGGAPIATRAHQGQVVAAGFSIVLLSIVSLALLGGTALPSAGWIGSATLILLPGYLLAMRTIFEYEKRRLAQAIAIPMRYPDTTMTRATVSYSLLAAIIVGAASFLPEAGAQISALSGLGDAFVGNLFIAFSTSLPEVVVSFAALRMGAVDLALGNLLGSNLFNMVILTIDDTLFVDGPILQIVASSQGIAALMAVAMTAVVIVALTVRAERRFLVTWESAALVVLYLVGVALMYRMRIPVAGLP